MEFEHNGSQYQITEHVSAYSDSHNIRLWYYDSTGRWEFGHSKEVPTGMETHKAMTLMRLFIEGYFTHDQYNEALP